MNISLTTTWHPRGESNRMGKHLNELLAIYSQIIIITPPFENLTINEAAEVREINRLTGVMVFQPGNWSGGRYTALEIALQTNSSHIQYADLDRLLRWMETRLNEWRQTVNQVLSCDCLIIGRTLSAYQTHPAALVQTEAISNRVVSHFMGKSMDVSAGSKGFSRRAVEYLVAHTIPVRALGTDAEWPILLHRAGFRIDYVEVDGLDWESADRYKDHAANQEDQLQAAIQYDADPRHWVRRVEIAHEIVETALATGVRPIGLRE